MKSGPNLFNQIRLQLSTARQIGRKASKDKGKQKSLSTKSIDRIEEAMKEQFNLDAEKIEAMNKYTEAVKERERKKEECEKIVR